MNRAILPRALTVLVATTLMLTSIASAQIDCPIQAAAAAAAAAAPPAPAPISSASSVPDSPASAASISAIRQPLGSAYRGAFQNTARPIPFASGQQMFNGQMQAYQASRVAALAANRAAFAKTEMSAERRESIQQRHARRAYEYALAAHYKGKRSTALRFFTRASRAAPSSDYGRKASEALRKLDPDEAR